MMPVLAAADGRALVISYADAAFVASAADVSAIDGDARSARLPVRGAFDLAPLLERHGSPDEGIPPVRLIVGAGRGRIAFRVTAGVDFTRPAALYRLPRLLGSLGCRPWVLGLALLPGPGDDAEQRLAIWIDLLRLARQVNQESEDE